jgi:hypothetical protein
MIVALDALFFTALNSLIWMLYPKKAVSQWPLTQIVFGHLYGLNNSIHFWRLRPSIQHCRKTFSIFCRFKDAAII